MLNFRISAFTAAILQEQSAISLRSAIAPKRTLDTLWFKFVTVTTSQITNIEFHIILSFLSHRKSMDKIHNRWGYVSLAASLSRLSLIPSLSVSGLLGFMPTRVSNKSVSVSPSLSRFTIDNYCDVYNLP